MPNAPQCRHLFTDGRQCGSPALRGTPLCFHHTAGRQPIPFKKLDGQTIPQLPAPDDHYAIQRAIGEVLRLLANDEITDRRATGFLRGLAIASQNLARAHRRERLDQAQPNPAQPVTDLVIHPTLGTLAVPEIHPAPETPVQQNQEFRTSSESRPGAGADDPSLAAASPEVGSPEPQAERPQPPVPTLNFTPHPELPLADEARLGQLYLDMQERSRLRRAEFETHKRAELEAEYEARYQQLLLQTSPHQNQDLRTSEGNLIFLPATVMPETDAHRLAS